MSRTAQQQAPETVAYIASIIILKSLLAQGSKFFHIPPAVSFQRPPAFLVRFITKQSHFLVPIFHIHYFVVASACQKQLKKGRFILAYSSIMAEKAWFSEQEANIMLLSLSVSRSHEYL